MSHDHIRILGLALFALIVSAFLATPLSTGQALPKNERELETSIPEHIPIKIKIKKESEATFKDLINEKWPKDFELEFTNTGTKPIYAVKLLLRTDDEVVADCRMTFLLTYGRAELKDINTKAEPTDIPIKPGKTVSLKIDSGGLEPWDFARRYGGAPSPTNVNVVFWSLSFGDGTGYGGFDGKRLPRPPEMRLLRIPPFRIN